MYTKYHKYLYFHQLLKKQEFKKFLKLEIFLF